MPTTHYDITADQLLAKYCEYMDGVCQGLPEGHPATRPGNREKFVWPPPPVAGEYNVRPEDWTVKRELKVDDEEFEVDIAHTNRGVFGRVHRLWNAAVGADEDEVIARLRLAAQPLFARQSLIAKAIGHPAPRFIGRIQDLSPLGLVSLFFVEDRSIVHDAAIEIEIHGSSHIFGPTLCKMLREKRHPHRRSAQWEVLDLFEDLPSFCPTVAEEADAISAIRDLIWDAQDDYARVIYKAGVVLGGHLANKHAAETLLECFDSPSKIGRRAAYHGTFHLAEWAPEYRDRIVAAHRKAAESDSEPILRSYAASMARDIEAENTDHVSDPFFPGEE